MLFLKKFATKFILIFLVFLTSCKDKEVVDSQKDGSTTTIILYGRNQLAQKHVVLIDVTTSVENSQKSSQLKGRTLKFSTSSINEINSKLNSSLSSLKYDDIKAQGVSAFVEKELKTISTFQKSTILNQDQILQLLDAKTVDVALVKPKDDGILLALIKAFSTEVSAQSEGDKVVSDVATAVTNVTEDCQSRGFDCYKSTSDMILSTKGLLEYVAKNVKDAVDKSTAYSAGDLYDDVSKKNEEVKKEEGQNGGVSASSFGDPHITTFDGVHYGFQGYGEFVAVKSTIDNFEIQVRQEDSYNTSNSTLTTGLAVQTGEDVVCFLSNPTRVYVNNKRQSDIPIGTTVSLKSEASIARTDKGYVVKSKNGSRVTVYFSGRYSVNYIVSLPDSFSSKIFGLLGNFDKTRNNDLQIRNGEYLIKDGNVSFEKLYPDYADSWRITQSNSLLVYEANQNTATFTKKDFPKSLASISAEQKAKAEAACRAAGVTSEPYLSSCIYDVAVTNDESLALSSFWGQSNKTNTSLLPIEIVQEPVAVKRIATRSAASFVLKEDGTLWAAGMNNFGQFGIGLSRDETENKNKFVKIMDGIKDISTGDGTHLLILKNDNSVWASGYNSNGQIGNGSNSGSNVLTATKIMENGKRLFTGSYASFIIKTDNTLWACGLGELLGYGKIENVYTPVKVADNVVEVATGSSQTLILKTDNSLWGMGSSLNGSLGIPASISYILKPVKLLDDVLTVSTNNKHTLIIKKDNSLWTTGDNTNGQLGIGSSGSNTTQYKFNKVMENAKLIATGYTNSFVVKADNTLWATGANEGQFGNGSDKNVTSFTQVATNIKAVVTNGGLSNKCTFILKTDNTIWATGENGSGQLGDGTRVNRTSFVPINVK